MRIGVNPEKKKEGILENKHRVEKRQIRVADGGNVPCAEVEVMLKDLGANRRRTWSGWNFKYIVLEEGKLDGIRVEARRLIRGDKGPAKVLWKRQGT